MNGTKAPMKAKSLQDLTAMRKALSKLMRACDSVGSSGACPIIHALATD